MGFMCMCLHAYPEVKRICKNSLWEFKDHCMKPLRVWKEPKCMSEVRMLPTALHCLLYTSIYVCIYHLINKVANDDMQK